MRGKWLPSRRSTFVGLLGATILIGSPLAAQADQGKWWNPEKGGRQRVKRQVTTHRAPAPRQTVRYSRQWRGQRIYRDHVWIRAGRSYRRPVYAWRYYSRPNFYYPRRIVYVRPVRFFISAGAAFGGVRVHARYARPDYIYGCNFCDARFETWNGYRTHVEDDCGYAPHGYRVHAREWEDDRWEDEEWHQDRNWVRDDHEEFDDDWDR